MKIDIFHYIYAVLSNPTYIEKYEINLKREIPKIPLYDDFEKWAGWGKMLIDIHINYENAELYKINLINSTIDESQGLKVVLKSNLEKGEIIIDEKTKISGIPTSAWEYKFGGRSALDWILDQYKEKKIKDPVINEKFNTYKFSDYKDYVITLLQKMITVSLNTNEIIEKMRDESQQI